MDAVFKRIVVGTALVLGVFVPVVSVTIYKGVKKLESVAPAATTGQPYAAALALPAAAPEPKVEPPSSAPAAEPASAAERAPAAEPSPPTSLAAAFGQALGVDVKDEPAAKPREKGAASAPAASKPPAGEAIDLKFSASARTAELGGNHREASLVPRRAHRPRPTEAPAPAEKITFEADPADFR